MPRADLPEPDRSACAVRRKNPALRWFRFRLGPQIALPEVADLDPELLAFLVAGELVVAHASFAHPTREFRCALLLVLNFDQPVLGLPSNFAAGPRQLPSICSGELTSSAADAAIAFRAS